MSETSITEWCLGLPLVEHRSLNMEEKHRLRRMAMRYLGQSVGAWIFYLLLVAIFVVFAVRTDPAEVMQQSVLSIVAIALTTLGLPITILVVRDWLRRSRGAFADIQKGLVKGYAGPLTSEVLYDPVLPKLIKVGWVIQDEGEDWSIEVLGASQSLWCINGQPVGSWIEVQAMEVADAPAFATLAADWLEPISQNADADILSGQREMTIAEKQELTRRIRLSWLRPLPLALGLTLWLSLPVFLLLVQHHLDHKWDYLQFSLLCVFTGMADMLFVSGLQEARRLRLDQKAGFVVIMRVNWKQNISAEIADQDTEFGGHNSQSKSELMELLPISRQVWTEQGKPAIWRKIPT